MGARGGHIYNSVQRTKILSSPLFAQEHCYVISVSRQPLTYDQERDFPYSSLSPFVSNYLTNSTRNHLSQALLCPGFCLLFPNLPFRVSPGQNWFAWGNGEHFAFVYSFDKH